MNFVQVIPLTAMILKFESLDTDVNYKQIFGKESFIFPQIDTVICLVI